MPFVILLQSRLSSISSLSIPEESSLPGLDLLLQFFCIWMALLWTGHRGFGGPSSNLTPDDCGHVGLSSWFLGRQTVDIADEIARACSKLSFDFTLVFLRRLVPCPCLDTCGVHFSPSRMHRVHFKAPSSKVHLTFALWQFSHALFDVKAMFSYIFVKGFLVFPRICFLSWLVSGVYFGQRYKHK